MCRTPCPSITELTTWHEQARTSCSLVARRVRRRPMAQKTRLGSCFRDWAGSSGSHEQRDRPIVVPFRTSVYSGVVSAGRRRTRPAHINEFAEVKASRRSVSLKDCQLGVDGAQVRVSVAFGAARSDRPCDGR